VFPLGQHIHADARTTQVSDFLDEAHAPIVTIVRFRDSNVHYRTPSRNPSGSHWRNEKLPGMRCSSTT